MAYENYSKEELLRRIDYLETVIFLLQEERDQEETLDYAWTGNLGRWYWEIGSNEVICNAKKYEAIGYSKDEVPKDIGYEFFTEKLHPEDYEPVMQNMREHLTGQRKAYEVEYRIKAKDGSYKWYYDRGVITKREEDGSPKLLAGIVFDITKKKEMEEELEKLALLDSLTQIMNRRTIFEFLENETKRAERDQHSISVLMFDIDHFKDINDKYGHAMGDRVLIEVAALIKEEIREIDGLGRYGGEEFLVVLSGSDLDHAFLVAERIRHRVAQNQFENGIRVTISGGLSAYKNQSLYDLVKEADKNLYVSKEKGRNCVSC